MSLSDAVTTTTSSSSLSSPPSHLSIETTIELDGWWGSKSAFIKRFSTLYRLKKRFQHKLDTEHDISNIDRPNEVAHVTLTVDGWPRPENSYTKVNGHKFVLTEDSIVVRKDHVEIPLPVVVESARHVHMTLFYQSGVKKDHQATLRHVFREVLQSLIDEPERPEDIVLSPYEVVIDNEKDALVVKKSRKSGKVGQVTGRRNSAKQRSRSHSPSSLLSSSSSEYESKDPSSASTMSHIAASTSSSSAAPPTVVNSKSEDTGRGRHRNKRPKIRDQLELILANQERMQQTLDDVLVKLM